MTNPPTEPTAGWYPDPTATASGTLRWWNGSGWSTEVRAAKPLVPGPVTPPSAPPAPPLALPAPAFPAPPALPASPALSSLPASPAPSPPYAASPPLAYPGAPAYAPQAGYPGQPGLPAQPMQPGSAYPGYTGYAPQNLVGPGEPKSFGGAISSVFKQYVGFGGRASRSEFWYFYLFTMLLSLGVWIIAALLVAGAAASSSGSSGGGDFTGFGLIVGLLYTASMIAGLGIVLPYLAVSVRRLRDAGQHWAWLFISFVPLGVIVLIVLWCQPSKPWALPRT